MKYFLDDLHILGPYPPPYGGVSVHISRMIPFLKEAGISYKVFNQYRGIDNDDCVISTNKSIVWWLKYFLIKKAKVVHIHQFSFFIFAYAFLISELSKSKIIVSVHNENIINNRAMYRVFSRFFIKISNRCTYLIVSPTVFRNLSEYGCQNVVFLPAYVPPTQTKNVYINDDAVARVFFNAWRMNQDLVSVYGFDLFCKVAILNPKLSFYCFIGDVGSIDFAESYIKSNNLLNVKVFGGVSLTEYFCNADVFLRLNRQDAYGISVQEALDLGVPVIASNVCERAKGAFLFENGSETDFLRVFNKLKETNFHFVYDSTFKTNYHNDLIELYKKYINKESYETSNSNS